MPEYLSKEEIKQWRSSLEKITLEEFAARLGKSIEEEKQTNDLVDIVLKNNKNGMSLGDSTIKPTRAERLTSIAERSVEMERPIVKPEKSVSKAPVKPLKEPALVSPKAEVKKEIPTKPVEIESKEDIQIVFKKSLTDREQMVFEYLLKNKNQVVFAKDLAQLLGLPRDYIYKYIKNLRAKIDGENLKNAESGGFLLEV